MCIATRLHIIEKSGYRITPSDIFQCLHGPAVEGSSKVVATAVGRRGSGTDTGSWTGRFGGWNPTSRRVLQALPYPRQEVRYRSQAVQKLLVISIVLETPVVGTELLLKLRLLRLQPGTSAHLS